MNEELQSTNEELETVNDELRERSEEFKLVNAFLESILGSLRGGVAVVDGEFLVQTWNAKAEDLWGLRGDEVRGKNLLNLDIGLPVDQLKPLIRACLSGEVRFQKVEFDATNRRGKPIRCQVTCTPMSSDGVTRVIIMMEEGAGARRDDDGEPVGPGSEDGRQWEAGGGTDDPGTQVAGDL
jgi:two-component system CheB/CheR fusion protein